MSSLTESGRNKGDKEPNLAFCVKTGTKQREGAVSMKRVLILVLALALLTGCVGGGSAAQTAPASAPTESTEPVSTVGPTPTASPAPMQPPRKLADPQGAAEAYADFALDLLRAGRAEGESILLSPLSVTLALGMTAMGAQGETAAAFEEVLGMDQETLAAYCAALMTDYGDLGGSSETNLVNSLWCDEDLTLNDPFVKTCEDSFDAELFHADLQDPKAVERVNGWVKEATRGMIPPVVKEFDPNTVLALVNAVYFKNQFAQPLITPGMGWTMDFQNADGTVSQPQGMSNGERKEAYLSHENGQGVVMPYDDSRLGLLLMLPDEGSSLTDYLAAWDCQTISGLLSGQESRTVDLQVPKFKAEWDGELKDALVALGLADAFDPQTADFTAMGHCDKGPLSIGSAIHKSAFEVNEKGTEAAAATVVDILCGDLPQIPDDLVILHFDSPFVYGIVDLEIGAPLFLGTMEQMD